MASRYHEGLLLFVCCLCSCLVEHTKAVTPGLTCSADWSYYGGVCYQVISTPAPWQLAKDNCNSNGAKLCEAAGYDVNVYVGQQLQAALSVGAATAWISYNTIGLTGPQSLSVGHWSDGTEISISVGIWGYNEPDIARGSCSYVQLDTIKNGYVWHMDVCDRFRPYICQRLACPSGSFSCATSDLCVPQSKLCDGHSDCPDDSDEANCPSQCRYWFRNVAQQIESPSWPSSYPANSVCQWTLEGAVGSRIEVQFWRFDTEEFVDEVEIYAGSMTISSGVSSGVRLAKLSGSLASMVDTYYSSNNILVIKFVTDATVQAAGFTASWRTAPVTAVNPSILTALDLPASLNTPFYPSNCPGGQWLVWVVTAQSAPVITLEILDIHIASGDRVTILNGQEPDSPVLLELTNGHSGTILTSTVRSVYITVVTGPAVARTGVKLTYQQGCIVDLSKANGRITSPGYDVISYPNGIKCSWKLTSPRRRSLKLNFESKFQLQDGVDYLKVYDGNNETAAALHSETGFTGSISPISVTSSGSVLYIVLLSSALVPSTGFTFTYNEGCGNVAVSSSVNTSLTPRDYGTYYGDTVIASCRPGYTFSDPTYRASNTITMTCQTNGQWSVLHIPECNAVYCGRIFEVTNGYVLSSTGAHASDTVIYACEEGYTMTGSSHIICQNTSTWQSAPRCSAPACSALSFVRDSSMWTLTGDGRSFRTIVQFNCSTGYDLIGFERLSCQSDGNWTHPSPVCQRQSCIDPSPLLNGKVLSTGPYFYNDAVNVWCDTGFRASSAVNYRGCIDSAPECIDIDECAEDISGCSQRCANVAGGYTCSCDPGYRVDPVNIHLCHDINECNTANGHCSFELGCNNTVGSYYCTCSTGHILYQYFAHNGFNPGSETSLEPWNIYYINHTCIPEKCPDPSLTIVSGQALTLQRAYYYGNTVSYMCHIGKVIVGSKTRTCLETGQWDNPEPQCIVAQCPPLSLAGLANPPTGMPTGNTSYFTSIFLECNVDGIITRPSLQCLYDRTLDDYQLIGDSLECPVIDCGVPQYITGAKPYIVTCTTVGCQLTVECLTSQWIQKGQSSLGNNVVGCSTDGRWDFQDIRCEGPVCDDPGRPADGEQHATTYELGSYVSYTCNRTGFAPDNPDPLECVYDASASPTPLRWNSTVPSCVDITPPKFPNCTLDPIIILANAAPSFTIPDTVDNSGIIKRIETNPLNFYPSNPVATEMDVIYIAEDLAGNIGRCLIQIKMKDQIPPVISCRPSSTITIQNETHVATYEAGILGATDNVAVTSITFDPPSLRLTRNNVGRIFTVLASALDAAGNVATCSMQVSVIAAKCKPYSIQVANGKVACARKIGDTGYLCDITCNGGYSFFQDTELTNIRMECNIGADWDKAVPDCIALFYPTYHQSFVLGYTVSSSVTDLCISLYQQQITASMPSVVSNLTSIFGSLIIPPLTLALLTIADDASPGLEFSHKRALSELQVTMNLKVVDLGRETVVYAALADYIYTAISTQHGVLDPVKTLNPAGCGSVTSVYKSMETNSFVCHGHEELRSIGEMMRCLDCPVGYYSPHMTRCLQCPVGTYRSRPNADTCPACPAGTRSVARGARAVDECSRTCPEGMISSDGRAPCDQCPVNTYSVNTTTCQSCPVNTYTIGIGKKSVSDCIEPCPVGTFSYNGLKPCTSCPINSYQDEVKQMTCLPCGSNYITSASARTKRADCIFAYFQLCDTSPCQHGGTCNVMNSQYYCICASGYTGRNCDVDINECDSSPCYHGGGCINLVNGFTCSCLTDTSGNRCEFEKDDCATATCLNSGVCHDLIGGSTCICPSFSGFSPPNCGTVRDVCTEQPCLNSGRCTAFGDIRRICTCNSGYTGDSCETNIDDCVSSPCLNGGFCNDLLDDYSCDCVINEYYGKSCQYRANVCAGSPCGRLGMCLDNYQNGTKMCLCQPHNELVGGTCVSIDYCRSTPCQNNGTCNSYSSGFTCDCVVGYEGKLCQHNFDNCVINPCMNDGLCVDKVNDYECICTKPNTGGASCADTHNNCVPLPCQRGNYARCDDLYEDYICHCNTGFTGKDCTESIDHCLSYPCHHGSTCVTSVASYSCMCGDGWTGNQCETLIDMCTRSSCSIHSTCLNTGDNYQCLCDTSYRGNLCQFGYNVCAMANHCSASTADCQVVNGHVNCSCELGFSGDGCEVVVDSCDGVTCQNQGSCVSRPGLFICSCLTGFIGRLCESNVNDCGVGSCPVGSTCADGVNTFTCECPMGKMGNTCNKDVPYTAGLIINISPEASPIISQRPHSFAGNGLTVAFWVDYMSDTSTGKILTIYSLSSDNPAGVKSEVLTIDHAGARLMFGGVGRNVTLRNVINDCVCHHVILTWSRLSGQVKFYVDKQPSGTSAGYMQSLPPFIMLELGGASSGTTSQFRGTVSELRVISQEISYPVEVAELFQNPRFIPNNALLALTDDLVVKSAAAKLYSTFTSREAKCAAEQTCAASVVTDAVGIVSCIEHQLLISTDREAQLTWREPVFKNAVTVTSSQQQGAVLGWGTHHVPYTAEDRYGGISVCNIRLVNRRYQCAQSGNPIDGRRTCDLTTSTPGVTSVQCSVECTVPASLPSYPAPRHYSCDVYSMFGTQEMSTSYQYPACTASANPALNILFRLMYTFPTTCSNDNNAFKQQLRTTFGVINSNWSQALCNAADCSAIPVFINCTSPSTTNRGMVESLFTAVSDPLTSSALISLFVVATNRPLDVLRLHVIDRTTLDLQASVGATPDKYSLELRAVPYCKPGSELIVMAMDTFCVSCGPGSFYSSGSARCLPCAKGTYQPNQAQLSCISCPSAGQTTATEGADSADQCLVECVVGTSYDTVTSQCVNCKLGFYQDLPGQFFCKPCPVFSFTEVVAATSASQCIGATTTTSVPTEKPIDQPAVGQSLSSSSTATGTSFTSAELAGILIGCIILTALLLIIIWCCCRERIIARFTRGKGVGKVQPEGKAKWMYNSRYGDTNEKYVNYKLGEILDKKGPVITSPHKAYYDTYDDKTALVAQLDGDRVSQNGPVTLAGPLESEAAPPLQNAQGPVESDVTKKKKKKKHRKKRKVNDYTDGPDTGEVMDTQEPVQGSIPPISTIDTHDQLYIAQNSMSPRALPPIPNPVTLSNGDAGRASTTSFAYWRGALQGKHPTEDPKPGLSSHEQPHIRSSLMDPGAYLPTQPTYGDSLDLDVLQAQSGNLYTQYDTISANQASENWFYVESDHEDYR